MPARIRLKFSLKLFLSHFIAVLLVSGSIGTFFYINAIDSLIRSLRSRLQNSAALLSQSIDARDLEALRSEADITQPIYITTLERLRRLRRANPDIAFLYIMRLEGDHINFVVDSDETDRQALPGRVYDDAPERMHEGFHEPAVDEKPYRDEWGVFLSGYAPLRNGEGRYLVGMDMRADEVDNKLSQLRLTGLVSLLASLLLALIFALYLSRGLTGRINTLIKRCRRLALGRFDEKIEMQTHDEFDDLIEAFNTMSEELSQARAKTDQVMTELRDAHDHLDQRVKDRTEALETALEKVKVLSGLLPICCSCKKIRNDQGYWQQVEQFVSMHTGARFSHSFCPECGAKYYGDILSRKDK
ncbi:MAG: HAMP domain-containing protein [Desulfobacteraceae bacterium]|nr:HAMP domain-containing protein [Desulfobacteraceae bacterium]